MKTETYHCDRCKLSMGNERWGSAIIQTFGGNVKKANTQVDLCQACQDVLMTFFPKQENVPFFKPPCDHPALAGGKCAICGGVP